jgi:hypothetical protein
VVQTARLVALRLATELSCDRNSAAGLAAFVPRGRDIRNAHTYQIFGRFEPALGLPEETAWNGALSRLDWRVSLIIAAMFVFSVLQLSHVSPFLYYQF